MKVNGKNQVIKGCLNTQAIKSIYRQSARQYLPWLVPVEQVKTLPRLDILDACGLPTQIQSAEKSMRANKHGQCVCCRGQIEPGQDIYWAPMAPFGTARHAVCALTEEYEQLLRWGDYLECKWYLDQALGVLEQYPGFLKEYGKQFDRLINLEPADTTAN